MRSLRFHVLLLALGPSLLWLSCSSSEGNRETLTNTGGSGNSGGDVPSAGGNTTGGRSFPGTGASTAGSFSGGGSPSSGGAASGGTTPTPGGNTGNGGPLGGAYFSTSFEADNAGPQCRNEDSSFSAETNASCDATERATHGRQAGSTHQPSGQYMLVVEGGFSVASGDLWLSYDMFAESRPTFTIMMDAWRRGRNQSSPDNPWDNRNPFSIEWRDGWFAMNCDYPNDHGTERRSPQVSMDMGVGSWVNVVAHYNMDTRNGAFWVRRVDAQGQPMGDLSTMSPTGRVSCSAHGDRGPIEGLAFSDFQHQSPVRIWTDRWILSDKMSDMP